MSIVNEYALKSLTNELVQADNIPITSHRGQTVSTVISNIEEECESIKNPMTMKLDNVTNIFSVGQGTNADVSKDVVTGKVEVELKGKTYQNVVPNMPNKTILGNSKIVDGIVYIEDEARSTHVQSYWMEDSLKLIKTSTVYTVITYIYENNLDIGFNIINNYNTTGGCYSKNYVGVPIGYTGFFVGTFTTRDSFVGYSRLGFIANVAVKGNAKFSVPMIFEGDLTDELTNNNTPYFTGIQSAFKDGIVDVEVTGKNLCEPINSSTLTGTNINFIENGFIKNISTSWNSNTYYTIDAKYLKRDTSYELRYDVIENINRPSLYRITYYNNDVEVFYESRQSNAFIHTFTTPNTSFNKIKFSYKNNSLTMQEGFKNTRIYQVGHSSLYEPYNKKKISFNIGEPLRSLPNHICDEIRINNGQWELVRRVGKVIFVGNETNLIFSYNFENNLRFRTNSNNYKPSAQALCDRFVFGSTQGDDSWRFFIGTSGNVEFNIPKTQVATGDVSVFKTWLKNNPTTVYYELATPVITPIEPISFDVKPLSTMYINSLIAPVSTHSVELNRTAQIERTILEIAELKNRVDILEQAYDSHFIETQYKLSLLGMDYELETEEI